MSFMYNVSTHTAKFITYSPYTTIPRLVLNLRLIPCQTQSMLHGGHFAFVILMVKCT